MNYLMYVLLYEGVGDAAGTLEKKYSILDCSITYFYCKHKLVGKFVI